MLGNKAWQTGGPTTFSFWLSPSYASERPLTATYFSCFVPPYIPYRKFSQSLTNITVQPLKTNVTTSKDIKPLPFLISWGVLWWRMRKCTIFFNWVFGRVLQVWNILFTVIWHDISSYFLYNFLINLSPKKQFIPFIF